VIEPTLVMVVHNEAHRLEPLLEHVRPRFKSVIICVQESTDGTREIVERYADVTLDDEHKGFGDASLPLIQRRVRTTWVMRLDADEWPTPPLLEDLPNAIRHAEERNLHGLWIPFRSWIEGVEWKVPHSHLRLWRNQIHWPAKLHSRPMTHKTEVWPTGHIHHSKTLDEHVRGYLGYLAVSGDNKDWIRHNTAMIEAACRGSAEVHGWGFVEGHEWWPEVLGKVFHDKVVERSVVAEP
jgi:glycosyltransferase involved in cell wall biosynthesis